tara:strand:+ start:249 stop:482 length:234 start_codon:yes stop_codon:yes gene_type:complete
MAHPDLMTGEPSATQVVFWVQPEARGDLGRRLIGVAERWLRSRGGWRLALMANSTAEARLLRRWGYTITHHAMERRH